MVLTTHRFLAPGCETVGDKSSPPICTCTGMSWGDFYLYVLNKIGCLALRKAPNSHQAKQPVSFYMRRHHGCDSPNSDDNFKKYFTNSMAMYIKYVFIVQKMINYSYLLCAWLSQKCTFSTLKIVTT